jgi:hypothetical protein
MSAADAATAVRKLQSGQPLTDAEKKLLGMSVTPSKATLTQAEIDARTAAVVAAGGKSTDPANRLPGETASQANARITAGYKAQTQPELTTEGAKAGATIEFVRTGAGGVGEYKEVFPIGTAIPGARTTASGNVYDAQGNLISGTGLKTVTGGTKTPAQLEAERLQKIADEALAKSNASQAALKRLQDIQAKLGRGETLTAEEYALIGVTPPKGTTSSSDTQPGKAWVKGADGKWVKPAMPTDGKTYSWDDNAGWTLSKGGDTATVTEVSRITNADGSTTVTYSDGTKKVFPKIGGGPDALDIKLISTYVDDATGDTVGYFSDGSRKILNKGNGPVRSEQFNDAYSLLKKTFEDYGLAELVPVIQNLMDRGIAPQQATLELRSSKPYQLRFKGNELRLAAGKNALDEATYLATENAYDETLKAFGQQNYFGIDRKAKQAKTAEIIGNDISADEFKNRVSLAVTRVQNADPSIKKLLKEFYPTLNDADLIGYFLNPTEQLPKLKEKVTSAEIGSAFLGQGLAYTQERSAELAQYGIDRASAITGAKEIKDVLPTSEKLADIYNEADIKYNQRTAEEEFLKDNVDAAQKRKRLKSMERAQFMGASGVGKTSLSRNAQGLI